MRARDFTFPVGGRKGKLDGNVERAWKILISIEYKYSHTIFQPEHESIVTRNNSNNYSPSRNLVSSSIIHRFMLLMLALSDFAQNISRFFSNSWIARRSQRRHENALGLIRLHPSNFFPWFRLGKQENYQKNERRETPCHLHRLFFLADTLVDSRPTRLCSNLIRPHARFGRCGGQIALRTDDDWGQLISG